MYRGARVICRELGPHTRIGLYPHNMGDLFYCPLVHNPFASWSGPVFAVALVLPLPCGR